jgi:hypothetical protein
MADAVGLACEIARELATWQRDVDRAARRLARQGFDVERDDILAVLERTTGMDPAGPCRPGFQRFHTPGPGPARVGSSWPKTMIP